MTVICSRNQGLPSLAVLAASFGMLAFSPSAEADFAKTIVDASTGDDLGSITFPTTSGSSPAGLTFDLEGFTEVDIKSVSWELDQVTLEVQSLTLHALQGDDPCPGSFNVACSNSTLDLTDQQFQTGGNSCTGAPPGGVGSCSAFTSIPRAIDFIDAAPAFACVGFEPPLADGPVTVRRNRALPLRAELFDSDGIAVTDADVEAAPVVQVAFDPSVAAASQDVSDEAMWAGAGDDGNQFVFRDGKWQFRLKVGQFTAPGTYTVTMASGNEAEYRVDPTCKAQFVVQ